MLLRNWVAPIELGRKSRELEGGIGKKGKNVQWTKTQVESLSLLVLGSIPYFSTVLLEGTPTALHEI